MSPRLAVLNKKGKMKELIYIEFEAPSTYCDRINKPYSWSTIFCENITPFCSGFTSKFALEDKSLVNEMDLHQLCTSGPNLGWIFIVNSRSVTVKNVPKEMKIYWHIYVAISSFRTYCVLDIPSFKAKSSIPLAKDIDNQVNS